MDNDLFQPFKAAQEAESKSFAEGFRSAWFRCKIKEISFRKGVLGHRLEYFDYPDEKVRWVKLYEKPPYANQGLDQHDKFELMLRPRYPPFYRESEVPDVLPESDVIVIVNDTWKVGDLVDWWCDGCFWSGSVTQILGSDKVQVLGNGRYCAYLDWMHEKDRPRSYLGSVGRENGVIEVITDRVDEPSSSDDNDNSFDDDDDDKNELGAFKRSFAKGRYTFVADDTDFSPLKYMMSGRCSTTLESSIMNLEEVACRIRWLKGLLKFGIQWSDLMIPSWKFLETHKVHLRR